MSNLGMFGPPTPSGGSGSDTNLDAALTPTGAFVEHREHERKGRKKVLEDEQENIIYHAIAFVLCQE